MWQTLSYYREQEAVMGDSYSLFYYSTKGDDGAPRAMAPDECNGKEAVIPTEIVYNGTVKNDSMKGGQK